MPIRTVIVGSSVAGVRVARALRAKGADDELVLVGEEDELPYDKPALSKAVLAGRPVPKNNCLLSRAEADELRVELRLGTRAESLDLVANSVHTSAGVIGFDNLVIATGARARTLPWADRPRVHLLRTLADCDGLRRAIGGIRRLLVVGGGFIGCEVAATARGLGIEVVLVEPQQTILAGAGPELAGIMAELHSARGVVVRTGCAVSDVRTGADGIQARLDTGEVVSADLAVVGVGAVPNTEWLAGSGLDVSDGVACDGHGRVLLAGPDGTKPLGHVYAVGDASRWQDPRGGRARRVEHWTNAVEQANLVARMILGQRQSADASSAIEPHVATAYVWSDQYDWTVHLVGSRARAREVVRVRSGKPEQTALIGADDDGALAFAAVVNWPAALIAVRKAAKDGAPAEPLQERLAAMASGQDREGAIARTPSV